MSKMMDEIVANLLEPGDWLRRLHAPYRLIMQDTNTGAWVGSDWSTYAEAAIMSMLKTDPFPSPERRMAVVDGDGWIVLGYSTDPSYVDTYGRPAWWGSEFGFALAESCGILDPVELAMIESQARDLSDRGEWWQ